ncbi:hypothetical protein [Streptomyces sp. JJ36]|uniref:hypothetical protein n=1 Tax=Streptomyces sp. JJ36 TaxID=2736645 RepID=UPI001F44266B|nr:hypothetical protein [Streptomyces sp. JJ36]MCF6522024.1 hypothetical protein [Streptomyces sp. JJ36]
MSMRRTKARTAVTAVATAAGLVLTLGACGIGDDDPSEPEKSASAEGAEDGGSGGGEQSTSEGDDQVLAQVKSGDIALTIRSARREEGGFVTVTGTVTNNGSGVWTGIEWKSDETELSLKNPASMAAARLVDKAGKKRYYILRDTEGRCLCTAFKGGLNSGESESWYTQFPAPPKGNDEVDFQIADMPPATITLSEG